MPIIIPAPTPPGTDLIELGVQRDLTHAFIMTMPVQIVLTPRTKAKKPGGGFVWVDEVSRVEQTMRMIEGGTVGSEPRPETTLDGVERRIEFELLGEWDAQVARYDTFTHQGKEWEVVDLFYENNWERRALVSGRG